MQTHTHANCTQHTHTHSYSSVLHPNVPWGTLVLPLSSIWETIHSPGERRGMGRYVLLSTVTEKSHDINQTQIQDSMIGCFHTNIWDHGIIFQVILCWLTGTYSSARCTTTQQCFHSTTENCIRVMGKTLTVQVQIAESRDSKELHRGCIWHWCVKHIFSWQLMDI